MRSKVKSQIWEGVDIVIFLPQQSSNSLDSLLQRSHIRLLPMYFLPMYFSLYIVFYNFRSVYCSQNYMYTQYTQVAIFLHRFWGEIHWVSVLLCTCHREWMEGWCLSELVEMPINDQYHSSISWGLRYWTFSWSWNA